jgi:murein DD-endopeptidase MepM/ murein hydrolase activator NlpD
MIRVFLLIMLATLPEVVLAAELYRYQDSEGNWVFGDKKSFGNKLPGKKVVERINIKNEGIHVEKPQLTVTSVQKKRSVETMWLLSNPLPVSVQHWLAAKGEKGFFTSKIAKPFEQITIDPNSFSRQLKKHEIDHYYLLGEPIDKPKEEIIGLPFPKHKKYTVSQGFNGRYSHTGRGNRFAVDIAMPIGETIVAVKSGIVADAADHFSIGGAANYFLDKANHVTVMHSDGSYAIYAHILYGSLSVKVGDRVKAGQELARVGNTGYSTGPHLHFVMRYNSGQGAYSIPFRFKTNKGIEKPKQGRTYSGL